MKILNEALERERRRKSLPGPIERRLFRMQAGLTQQDVAACLKLSRAAISRYESGDRAPRGKTLDRYLDVLGKLSDAKSA